MGLQSRTSVENVSSHVHNITNKDHGPKLKGGGGGAGGLLFLTGPSSSLSCLVLRGNGRGGGEKGRLPTYLAEEDGLGMVWVTYVPG